VLLHVTDFLHYLYVAVPVNFGPNDTQAYKLYLEAQLAQYQTAIHSVQIVMRENIYGFQGNQKSPYLKITVTDPKFINRLRSLIENDNANYKGMWKSNDGKILTFDSIQYVLRFMIDCKVRIHTVYQGSYTNFSRSPACHGLRPLLQSTI
jgi:DNA polymerase delta subunit 1